MIKLDLMIKKIFSVSTSVEFDELAFDIFNYQYKSNSVYNQYVNYLGINPRSVSNIEMIPFLPVEFFKSHNVIADGLNYETIFLSSATTGTKQSQHFVADLSLYKESFLKCFNYFFGNPRDYCFLALLPSYLERKGSSLIFMINELMIQSGHADNGYFLNEYNEINCKIDRLEKLGQKYMLFGVTYALLDFASNFKQEIKNGIVIETGGMKGRRKEMSKPELHDYLKKNLKTESIYSEYGMTELLSQAWSMGDNIFKTPSWMKVIIRDTYDPFRYVANGVSGGINVIDLANIHSCAFIETKDLGKSNQNGQFEVLGRFDNSDIRGCNLLIS